MIIYSGGRAYEQLRVELNSRISIDSGIYVVRRPAWQLLLSGDLLWSALGDFVETTTVFRFLIGIVVDGYRLKSTVPDKWFLFV